MSITYNYYRDQMNEVRDGQPLPTWEELLVKKPAEAAAFQFIDNEYISKRMLVLGEVSKMEKSINKMRWIAEVV